MTAQEHAEQFTFLTAPERSMKYLARSEQGKVYTHVYAAAELALVAAERVSQPRAYIENAARRLHAATGIRMTLESIGGLLRERRIRAVMVKRAETAALFGDADIGPPPAPAGEPANPNTGGLLELVRELAVKVEAQRQDFGSAVATLRTEFAKEIAALCARLDKVEDGHDLFVDQNASLRGAIDKIRGMGKDFQDFDHTSDKIARSRIRPLPTPDQAPTTPDPGT